MRVVTIDVDQIEQIVDFLLIAMLDYFVAQIHYKFHELFEVFTVGFNLLILRVNETVVRLFPSFVFQVSAEEQDVQLKNNQKVLIQFRPTCEI